MFLDGVLYLSIATKLHHFRLFLRNMGQTPYYPPLISTFPWELIAIMSFEDQSFELALAMACKTLYERYELYYAKKTVVVLYYSQR